MQNKILGQSLLWIGFVSGALATVWQAPEKGVEFVKELSDLKNQSQRTQEENDKLNKLLFEIGDLSQIEIKQDGWHLVNWTWYGCSAIVGIVGIVFIRIGSAESSKKSEKTEAGLAEITTSLHQLVHKVGQLAKESNYLPPSKILSRIDEDLGDDFRIFADGRDSLAAEFGLAVFADVMSNFSSGERSVNRAWCAAADGYVDEAETCLQRAEKMLHRAYQDLSSAK
ncbi:hypothetical protein OAG56_00205 [Mariniblastus sp.]|jgi:hypothetical protein|nr:hypothetical protein [Mariniblastus sp.]MDB4755763.1 hypothetical protein [Mariniblastus sp.]